MIHKLTILATFCLLYQITEALVTQQQAPECVLNKRPGNCIQNHPRYFYNKETGQCETFTYSGCGGNLNNFKSLDECNGRCVCSQTVEPGNGTLSRRRFYYDVVAQRCKPFTFTGSSGNENRFPTFRKCQDTCANAQVREQCDIRPNAGFHCSIKNATKQFYFDQNCNCCRSFRYFGCGGNTNRFPTFASCRDMCKVQKPPREEDDKRVICYQQAEYGSCTGEHIRYYFDTVRDKCVPFVYSGCGGNRNNFRKLERCSRVCGNSTITLGVAQFQQTDDFRSEIPPRNDNTVDIPVNNGNDTLVVSTDTSELDSLIQFVVESGLGGEGTTQSPNTDTVIVPDECLPAPSRGDCVFNLKRYFYDKDLMMCRPFAWSGCGGNSNRFYSEIQCESTCVFN